MPRLILAVALVSTTLSLPALAQATSGASGGRKTAQETSLKKESSVAPDKSLAGDITRKKESGPNAPMLQYDQFRLGVELQVASKRHEQIESLKKIISFSTDGANDKEMPSLLFRLGELYWEESKYFFFEANRKDDELAKVGDDAGEKERIKNERAKLMTKSKDFGKLAMDQYSNIVQNFKDYERTDEVLYFLGHNLMESGDDHKSLVAYKRLIDKYPKSKYVPDAHLAFGEYYFNNSLGKRNLLEKALDSYKKAASFPESQVYGFALYKQGWCYFNMADYQRAMDMFKSVVLYGELAGAESLEKDPKNAGKGKSSLVREARNDFVRAYARIGSPADAKEVFSHVASKPDDRFLMMRQLANIYYDDGKDKEAALTFNALIRERPLSPEAPLFQGKIVDCVLRAGNKRMTVEQVRRLVKLMQEVEQAGTAKDEAGKKALGAARDLSERTLSNIAVNWHNEAKKTRDDETFNLANEVYADYLTLFSASPKAYDLRFFWAELLYDNLARYDRAAEEYTKVVMIDAQRMEGKPAKDGGKAIKPGKPGRWLEKAAYNAVLAYDEVVKAAVSKGTLKTDVHGTEQVAIPPQEQALIDACVKYLKYVPNGDKRVEITFKMANLYYRRNHFDEAVARFSDIALNHPDYKFENGERAGELAANLVLSAYDELKDFAKLNEWARKFYANDKLAVGKFRDELAKVLERSSFQLVAQLEKKNEYVKAAEAYLTFVTEFPGSEIADKALFNASIDFFKGRQLDRSIEMRQRLIEKYPRSPFVPAAMFANAESYEAVADFDAAADAYELYAREYEKSTGKVAVRAPRGKKSGKRHGRNSPVSELPKLPAKDKDGNPLPGWEESKAQIALLNAGIYREGLGQLKQAMKNREKFLELWPNAKDSEAVYLSMVELFDKMGQTNKAFGQLEQYERDNVSNPTKVLTAEGRIVRLYESRKRAKEAARINHRINEYFEKLGPRQRKALDDAALDAVAKAHNQDAEVEFAKFQAIRLRWGKLPSPEKEFKAALAEKLHALDAVKKTYTTTVSFKQGDPAICALYRIGTAYDHMVDTMLNVPMPKAFPQEVQDALREEFANQAQPLKTQASEAFGAAVQKSRELSLHNSCADKSLKLLRDKYEPEKNPPVLEEVAELKAIKPSASGEGLLTSVQEVPSSYKAATPEANGQDEHKQLGLKLKAQGDMDRQADQKPTPAPETKPSKPDSEPEDLL